MTVTETDWTKAEYRRRGLDEVASFQAGAVVPPWLQRLARTVHEHQEPGPLGLIAKASEQVAYVQRLPAAAQDGTGRGDWVTHVGWWAGGDDAARADRLCRTLLAVLLRSPDLMEGRDPQGLASAWDAVAAEGAGAVGAALELLARLAGGTARVATPEPDTVPACALALAVRTALVLAGDTLELVVAAGFSRSLPAVDPLPAIWLVGHGEEPPLTPVRARALADSVAAVWRHGTGELGRAAARLRPLPPLRAIAACLALEGLPRPEGAGTSAADVGDALLDLWLHGPEGALRGVPALAMGDTFVRDTVERGADPVVQGGAPWDDWRRAVLRFGEARRWAKRLRAAPAEALADLARDAALQDLARDLAWDLFANREDASEWPGRIVATLQAAPALRAASPAILASVPFHLRLRLVEASRGVLTLAQAFAAEGS